MNDSETHVALNASEKVGCILLRRFLYRLQSLSRIAAAPEPALPEAEGSGAPQAAPTR